LAAQPTVKSALLSLAQREPVQAAGSYFLGAPHVPPETLLSVLIGLCLSFLLVLSIVPKGRLSLWAFFYFFFSADKKTRKPDDAVPDVKAPSCKKIKIVFIRHGQSEWNAVFNEGSKLTLPIRLARALISEALMFFDQDSLFLDSPLDEVGIRQSWQLMTFIASQPAQVLDKEALAKPVRDLEVADIVSMIRGDSGSTIMASSILRRAISTGFIALSPRFLKTDKAKDKVHLMTALQEISRNVDTLSLTPKLSAPVIPAGEAKLKHMGDLLEHFYRTRFDKRENHGNKARSNKAIKRQEQFANWALSRDEHMVIVLGHSIWFREFFKSYLPKSSKHVAKTAKLVNCGVVAFDFVKDSKNIYRIQEDSVKEIYGGFEDKSKKGKSK